MTAVVHQPLSAHRGVPQLALLVLLSGFVGAMVGLERTVLPLLAEAEFGIASRAAAITFIATFGLAKALVNLVAGGLSDRWGRRPVLLAGWLIGAPVPLLLMHAPSWRWVLAANVLLGVNQALTWSMTLVMKVDLAHPRRRGTVIGWNEFAGYAGMAATAAATGALAASHGLRPVPFYLGLVVVAGGLALSWRVSETRPEAARRPAGRARRAASGGLWLAAASLGGLATNLKDGVLWGLLPFLLEAEGISVARIGLVTGLYPAAWAVTQLAAGPLADRTGPERLVAGGLVVQSLGLAVFASGGGWTVYPAAALLAGLGTGMAYPTLQLLVSQRAGAARRASALGVYRFFRDLGYPVGALGGGIVADRLGLSAAIAASAGAALVAALVAGGMPGRPSRARTAG